MYAVIKSGGKQYRVEAGAQVRVELLSAEVGAAVAFEEVLLVGAGDSVKVGAPLVAGAKVTGTVVSHGRGDKVRIFNDRGATVLPATVTDRIARGVVSIKEGAWFTPDAGGTDRHGCANVLTADRSAPSGATTYNTNQVQVALLP